MIIVFELIQMLDLLPADAEVTAHDGKISIKRGDRSWQISATQDADDNQDEFFNRIRESGFA